MRADLCVALVLLLVLLAGCPKKETSDEDETAPRARAEPSASAPASFSSASSDMKVAGLGNVPSLEEWNAVGEVTVKGSSALNCETKMVRDWFRVSCRGKNDTGGKPTTVRLVSHRIPGTYEYAVGGITSLVAPFVDGTHIEAVFSWTDKSHKLVLDWPATAPKPAILGVFEGAKSPLDKPTSTSSFRDEVCQCEKKNPLFRTPQPDLDCGEVVVNEDCARTYTGDCLSYQKCALGEPGVAPRCLPGHEHIMINVCAKTCKSDGDCPGTKCGPSPFNEAQRVCQPG